MPVDREVSYADCGRAKEGISSDREIGWQAIVTGVYDSCPVKYISHSVDKQRTEEKTCTESAGSRENEVIARQIGLGCGIGDFPAPNARGKVMPWISHTTLAADARRWWEAGPTVHVLLSSHHRVGSPPDLITDSS